MTRSDTQNGHRPARSRALTLAALALAAAPLVGAVGCTQVRYTEAFAPDGDIRRVVVQSDAGLVELVEADELRVQRAIRAPEAALSLSHHVADGTLYLEAHCVRMLPCAVDTRVEIPAGLAVEVDLGSGELWATGISSLTLELDSGMADVELSGDLTASIGTGSIHARLASESRARVGVGRGDIEVDVPSGAWSVQAETARLRLVDLEPVADGLGHLELTAPAGTVTVRGTAGVASR